jgi:hypothetical protein
VSAANFTRYEQGMLKHALALAVMSAAVVVPSIASADNSEGKVYVTKVVTIVGHRQLPSVVVEIARLSAAKEAGIAHDSLRTALLEQSVPATLRPSQANR